MFSKLIAGGASLLLQAIFVVAAVLIFMFFDPFGFLSPVKRKLKDTPVQVESIKKLGELITAEYYGEVVASLGEVLDTINAEEVNNFVEVTNDLHEEFKLAIEDLAVAPDLDKKNHIYNVFYGEFPDIVNDPNYATYLFYINEKIKDHKYKKNDLGRTLSTRSEKVLLKRLCKNINGWGQKLKSIETEEFVSVFKKEVEKINNKKIRRTKLAMIGRGWVKAGFDFEEFDESNFRYSKRHNTIHFIGFQPKIISATINPWFIPEEGVEGFEFLIVERRLKKDPELTKMVKQRCLDKLSAQAHRKNILERATSNAEANLKGFFSLLMDEEIRAVKFHTDPLQYALSALLMDSVVRNEELFFIDSVLISYHKANKHKEGYYESVNAFINELHEHPCDIHGTDLKLNARSSVLFKIVQDRVIDERDMEMFRTAFDERELDKLWHAEVRLKSDSTLENVLSENIGVRESLNGTKDSLILNYKSEQKVMYNSILSAEQLVDNEQMLADLRSLLEGETILIDLLVPVPNASDSIPEIVPEDSLRAYPGIYFFGR